MPEQPGAGRLDPDTLAAYIDGQLPPEERARVEAEIATDPESYEWVVNAVNAVEDTSIADAVEPRPVHVDPAPIPAPGGGSSTTNVVPFRRRRAVLGGIGAFLAAAAALLLVVWTQPAWWQELWGPSVDPRFAKLVEAVGEERYIEARLTGGFKYGPLREVMRAPVDPGVANIRLLSVARELERQSVANPNAGVLHGLGVAFVLLGGPGDLDTGIGHLEAAATRGPDAAVMSDLAAAYLERFRRTGAGEDLRRALALTDSAVVLAPSSAPVLFNRALALQAAGRNDEARRAWEGFLALHASDPWAAEANRHLAQLTR